MLSPSLSLSFFSFLEQVDAADRRTGEAAVAVCSAGAWRWGFFFVLVRLGALAGFWRHSSCRQTKRKKLLEALRRRSGRTVACFFGKWKEQRRAHYCLWQNTYYWEPTPDHSVSIVFASR
jgi:hypothetical protein